MYTGSGATMFRNTFLFSAFVIYMDMQKQLLGGDGQSRVTGKLELFGQICVIGYDVDSYSFLIRFELLEPRNKKRDN